MWEAVTAFSKSSIKDVRFIAHKDISNAVTQAIIKRAVGDRKGDVIAFDHNTEAFRALLGTPNGAGGAHLLTQHKRRLGHKTMVRVTVLQHNWPPLPDLVFEVQDVPFPKSTHARPDLCRLLNIPGTNTLPVS